MWWPVQCMGAPGDVAHACTPPAYADEHPLDIELCKHVLDKHGEALRHVTSAWMTNSEVQRMGEAQFLWDLYKQALAVQERRGFPTVGVSVDRRVFEYTNQVYNDARIRSLLCFTCACIRLDTGAVRSEIRYRPASFLSNMSLHRLEDFFGFAEFSRRYMQAGTPLYPRDKSLPSADFSDWRLGCCLSFPSDVTKTYAFHRCSHDSCNVYAVGSSHLSPVIVSYTTSSVVSFRMPPRPMYSIVARRIHATILTSYTISSAHRAQQQLRYPRKCVAALAVSAPGEALHHSRAGRVWNHVLP